MPTRREFLKAGALAGLAGVSSSWAVARDGGTGGENARDAVRPGDLSLGSGLGFAHADCQLRTGEHSRRGTANHARATASNRRCPPQSAKR